MRATSSHRVSSMCRSPSPHTKGKGKINTSRPERGKKTSQQGASTIVFAATSPLLANIGGVYLKDNDVSRLDDEQRPLTADSIPSEITSQSIDPQAAQRLWELSEGLLSSR